MKTSRTSLRLAAVAALALTTPLLLPAADPSSSYGLGLAPFLHILGSLPPPLTIGPSLLAQQVFHHLDALLFRHDGVVLGHDLLLTQRERVSVLNERTLASHGRVQR